MFTSSVVFPGITHITDAMGVSFTLVEGRDSALLIDVGYGVENVQDYIASLTEKPVEVILTHGHHDHILGARYFNHTLIGREDLEEFRLRTSAAQREAVQSQALAKGLAVPADFMSAAIPDPIPVTWLDRMDDFDMTPYDLGGREVWLLRVPGHTPGSLVLYVPDSRLLLTGDDWNPCTWIWFPSAVPAPLWRNNMLCLLHTLERYSGASPETVLCSHQPAPREAGELYSFLEYATDARLRAAPPVDMNVGLYGTIRTHQLTEESRGWALVFDYDKFLAFL